MSRGRSSRYEYELERFIAACEPAGLDEVQRLKEVFDGTYAAAAAKHEDAWADLLDALRQTRIGRASIWIIFRLAAILNRTGKDRL